MLWSIRTYIILVGRSWQRVEHIPRRSFPEAWSKTEGPHSEGLVILKLWISRSVALQFHLLVCLSDVFPCDHTYHSAHNDSSPTYYLLRDEATPLRLQKQIDGN